MLRSSSWIRRAMVAALIASCLALPATLVSAAGADGASLIEAPRVQRLKQRGWVEVEAAVAASEEEAPATARSRALRRARQAAVEFVAGVEVRSSLLSLEQAGLGHEASLLQVLTATQSDALVVEEKLIDSEIALRDDGGYTVRIRMQARVLDHGRDDDAAFDTEVRLNREAFRPGEAVELAVRASRDARIYVIGVSDTGAVVLVPNRYMRDSSVKRGKWLRFPDESLQERGVRLEAQLPSGKRESSEVLIVIALRGDRRLEGIYPASDAPFQSAENDTAPQLLNDLLSPLLSLSSKHWTFDQVVYRISGD